jgi:hypothetical protein
MMAWSIPSGEEDGRRYFVEISFEENPLKKIPFSRRPFQTGFILALSQTLEAKPSPPVPIGANLTHLLPRVADKLGFPRPSPLFETFANGRAASH